MRWVSRTLSLARRDWLVLGPTLNRSESTCWACPRELSRLIALDELRIVLALDAAALHKHRRLEVEAALMVMLAAIAVFARSELRKRPFPLIQAIALLLHLDLIGARLVGDLEQLLEQAIGALFSRARVHVGKVFVGHKRRQTRNPTAEWLARQITEAFPWDTAPKYLIRDNDRAFGAVFKARVRAMGIRDRPTSFRSPWQNGLVERLIGSARHECTDHVIVLNEDHLRRILSKYASYYNEVRTHLSLGKDAPCTRPIERFGDIIAQPILGGLHHRYARI